MARMTVKESALRRHIRTWDEYLAGLVSFIEPAVGSDTGLPDTLFLLRGRLVPIELKRGESVVRELRPSQRSCHRSTLHAGGQTYGLTVREDKQVLMYALHLEGGLASELGERKLMRCDISELTFTVVFDIVMAYSFRG